MKKIFTIILLVAVLIPFTALKAEEKSAVILQLDDSPTVKPVEAEEIVNKFIDTAKYFDNQYPGTKIDEDFHQDVAEQFPALSRQEVYDYQGYIRNGMKIYRYFKGLYDKYIEAAITPEEPPLIADDSDYDLNSTDIEYIDADGTVVVQDFKKIISYSQNPREIKAYRAKLARDSEQGAKLSEFQELGYIFSKIELKKLLLYDIFYSSPLTGTRGIGSWEKKDDFKIRLITEQTGVVPDQKIRGLIHFMIPSDQFVTAVDSGKYSKPQFDFAKSENLKNIEYTLPLPTRMINNIEDWTIYTDEVAVPFTAEVIDPQKELILHADIKLDICQGSTQCEPSEFSPELKLMPGFERDSSVATYVRMMSNFLMPQHSTPAKLSSFNREYTPGGQEVLTLVFDSPDKIESFNVFVGNSAGMIFERPRTSIDGKRITVRLLSLTPELAADGKEFEITAQINRQYVFRLTQIPENGKAPAPDHRHLALIMFTTAVLGGFLLNFMPCVFPVLSLKLLSLTKFGARNRIAVRRNFSFTLLGIWSAFALLALILAALKIFGQSIGWGMQFQNPWFVSLIFFAVLLFVAQIWGLVEIKTPQFINHSFSSCDDNSLIHFLTGTLAVLMATPCTAPYLGTAVGFALAGSIPDIFLILSGVALGLSLPYILIYLLPGIAVMIPPPGLWMKKVSRFMLLMLFLTLVWLLHIVQSQCGTGFTVRLAFYGLLFWSVLWLRNLSRHMDYEELTPQMRAKAIRRLSLFFTFIAVLVFAGASLDGYFAALSRQKQSALSSLPGISRQTIDHYLKQGKTVMVAIDADWCLTCRYNDVMVFKNPAVVQKIQSRGVIVLNVDWTVSNQKTVEFMKKYGRSGLPFYILFSPLVPDGMVLPEILNEQDFNQLIDNMSLVTPKS